MVYLVVVSLSCLQGLYIAAVRKHGFHASLAMVLLKAHTHHTFGSISKEWQLLSLRFCNELSGLFPILITIVRSFTCLALYRSQYPSTPLRVDKSRNAQNSSLLSCQDKIMQASNFFLGHT
jgi:hypothetical protein